jgi:predicted chitinase
MVRVDRPRPAALPARLAFLAQPDLVQRHRQRAAEPAAYQPPPPGEQARVGLPGLDEVMGKTYTVAPGDSLWAIAQAKLGDGSRWPEIYELNKDVVGENPDLIHPGQVLRLPGAGDDAPLPAPAAPPEPAGEAARPAPAGEAATFDFAITPEQIAQALGAPEDSVRRNWPVVSQALQEAGITDKASVIAALATIGVEVGNFEPIPEYASGEAYEGRADLGNTQPGDGKRYKGRGFIQLTGRANYRAYGEKLGIDLEGHPELALDPKIAARILAAYFKERSIPARARAGDWQGVRRAVNGGLNGWEKFNATVQRLEAALH